MKRKLKRGILGGLGVVVAGVVGVVGYASWTWDRTVDAPYPQLHADVSPEGVTRGSAIFNAVCAGCHVAPGADRARGTQLTEAPEFLGKFYAPNLTSDPNAGIGALKDEEIARVIRFGINRHGKHTPMPSFSMSDADVAAVIGFMRSDDPLFRADPTVQPPSSLSAAGKTIIVLSGATKTPDLPAQGVTAPKKQATAEYGKYLAQSVYGCADCHTPGFAADKVKGPDAFTGGAEFRTPDGKPLYSANLTPDETGIAHYDREAFRRAVREGQRPDGSSLSAPMPQFKGVDNTELDAVYMYLQTIPKHHVEGPGATRRPAVTQR